MVLVGERWGGDEDCEQRILIGEEIQESETQRDRSGEFRWFCCKM